MPLAIPAARTSQQKAAYDEAAAMEKWKELETGIDQIYRRSRSSLSFQTMWSNSFSLVKHGYGKFCYTQLEESMRRRIAEQSDLVVKAEANLLKALVEQWQIHSLTTQRTADVLQHLDRQYCISAPIKPIVPLGMTIFGELVLKRPAIMERVQHIFLEIIEKERIGDEVPSDHLKGISAMLITVDRREIFEPVIERPYLEKTKEFYRNEASRLISPLSTPMFVQTFFERLEAERSRTLRCLDESSLVKVEGIMREVFFLPHQMTLLTKSGSGVDDLLKVWSVADLKQLYAAFYFAGDVAPLVKSAAAYLLNYGKSLVSDREVAANAVIFVEKLIDLRLKIDLLVKDAFNCEGRNRFVEVELNKAFEEVANKNSQCAEYLSLYFDQKLKNPDAEDIESCCDNVISVYKVLKDKDLFENAFKLHLSRRLLAAKVNTGEEYERMFLDKLKREFGASATSKLEGMFADKRISEELMEAFRSRLESRNERLPVDLTVSVLTSGFWPPTPSLNVPLPGELERCAAVFRNFYLSRHKGRRLEYQYSLGAVDIRMSVGRKYEVNLPLLSLPVLMLFPGDEKWTITEIAAKCGAIPVPEAVRLCVALTRQSTTHTGLLSVEGNPTGTTLTPTSVLSFNTGFKSKNLKVKIVAASLVTKESKEQTIPSDSNRGSLDEDRRYKLEAAIVRVMKSRRTLEHRVLVQEVINVLKNSFAPTPEEIKRRIEHLIEREFLERSSESRSHYNYLA